MRYFENFFLEHKDQIWFDDLYNPKTLHMIELCKAKSALNKFKSMMEKIGDYQNLEYFKKNLLDQQTPLSTKINQFLYSVDFD